jgi:hypothetical protein
MSGIVIISDDVKTPLKSIVMNEHENENDNDGHVDQQSVEGIVCNALNIPPESFGDVVCKTLLVRTTTDNDGRQCVPGMYAYHFNHHCATMDTMNMKPNIRATRLAMAMGLYRVRFYGIVVLVRESSNRQYEESMPSLLVDDIALACNVSPDLRSCIAKELQGGGCDGTCSNDDDDNACLQQPAVVPDWIANAAMNSYHDEDALSQLAAVMKRNLVQGQDEDEAAEELEDHGARSSTDVHAKDKPVAIDTNDKDDNSGGESSSSKSNDDDDERPVALPREFVAKSPLCFHCRGPAVSLCQGCYAVYFCELPRSCRSEWCVPFFLFLLVVFFVFVGRRS